MKYECYHIPDLAPSYFRDDSPLRTPHTLYEAVIIQAKSSELAASKFAKQLIKIWKTNYKEYLEINKWLLNLTNIDMLVKEAFTKPQKLTILCFDTNRNKTEHKVII